MSAPEIDATPATARTFPYRGLLIGLGIALALGAIALLSLRGAAAGLTPARQGYGQGLEVQPPRSSACGIITGAGLPFFAQSWLFSPSSRPTPWFTRYACQDALLA